MDGIKLDYDELTDMLYITFKKFDYRTTGSFWKPEIPEKVNGINGLNFMVDRDIKKIIGMCIIDFSSLIEND